MAVDTAKLRSRERNFYTLMAVSLAIIVFAGFARTFYLQGMFPEVRGLAAPERIFQVHGAIFTLWFAWLIAQCVLIRRRELRLHRTMGFVGVGLAILMFVVGIYGATVAAVRPGGFIGMPIPPNQFLAVPVFDLIMFGLFVAWAVVRRHDAQAHKRLMLFATLNLLDAAVARIPLPLIEQYAPISMYFGSWLMLAAILAWDLVTLRKLHFVTVWATLLTLLSQVIRLAIMGTAPWIAFADWLTTTLPGHP